MITVDIRGAGLSMKAVVPFLFFLRHLLGYLRVKLSSGFAEYLPLLAVNSATQRDMVHLCLFFFPLYLPGYLSS